jgi:cell fate regulator YaaT (PSP1 superfamily)
VGHEYLLSYGCLGDFGRFHSARPVNCRRGQHAVVHSHRGVELAVVLCPATPGHAHYLPNTTVGPLLRLATPEDEEAARRMHERGDRLFADARRLAADLGLPLEVIDAEVLLDGEQAVLHYFRGGEFDERDLVSKLAHQHDLRVALHDLSHGPHEEEDHGGCGRTGCGRTEGGGCSTCGSGGGCSTCGAAKPDDVRAYFAALREKMAAEHRKPLL